MPVVDVKHVALVGFMGAGKSTFGRRLAGRIRAALTDVDADLEDQFGPIPDYFEKHGEAAFRTVEEAAVTDALSRGTRSVVVLGGGAVALVSDSHVAGIHGVDAQLALGHRLAETHELPAGEEAKTLAALDHLWQELRLDRNGTLVALGGGCTTDAAGVAAATYLRGIAWVPVPTSLVAQVDAAVGGKTAVDLPQGKNLVGAFHLPARTVIDPALLETLPALQRREGMAEVVKTALLAGQPF